jgi:hypothetical protein
MTFKDLLLLGGTLPLIVVVAERLAAEAALRSAAPPPEALPAAAVVLGFALVAYVVLELRSTAREVRRIAARLEETTTPVPEVKPPPPTLRSRPGSQAQVSNFAIHLDRALELDRSLEVDLRAPRDPGDDPIDNGAPRPGARAEMLGEVQSLLSQIPSVRQGGAQGAAPTRTDGLDREGRPEPPPRDPVPRST